MHTARYPRPIKKPQGPLTPTQVNEIRYLHDQEGLGLMRIGRMLNIAPWRVYVVYKRLSYRSVV
jgi:hypothetical protein